MHLTGTAASVGRRVRFVEVAPRVLGLEEELRAAVQEVIERGDFILGQDVGRFEEEFAGFCGTAHAVGVDSGFSALELALRSAGVGAGDEVVTQANTFVATVGAILALGAVPVLADCDRVGAPDPDSFSARITSATRAVIPVHLFGRLADMEPYTRMARTHGLVLVEDACQAHGARRGGRRAGSWGTASAFSFYPAKNLGALGDAGMLVTDSAEVADRARRLRNYGQRVKYEHELGPPIGRRLDTLHAAALRVKLPHLDAWNAMREERADRYRALLRGLPIGLPEPEPAGAHVYHLFVVETDERDRLRAFLDERGIDSGIHYPIPLHLQPALAHLGYRPGDFPNAERLAATSLSLPMYPQLSFEDLEYVAESIHAYFERRR